MNNFLSDLKTVKGICTNAYEVYAFQTPMGRYVIMYGFLHQGLRITEAVEDFYIANEVFDSLLKAINSEVN